MPADLEPLIIRFTEECDEIIDVCAHLSDAEWDTPTELPGWTVKDCVSHIVGTELSLLGAPMPTVDVAHLAHVGDDFIAAAIESWVEERRGRPGTDVLSELRSVSIRRVAVLRRLAPKDWDSVGPTPLGPLPYRTFLEIRIFDCWMHEQDIRRALDKPGHREGDVIEIVLARIGAALGKVIAKSAGAPDGSRVVVSISGASARDLALGVEGGRARLLGKVPKEPTARIELDLEALAALCGGRWLATEALERGAVRLSGDMDLATRVIHNFAFTP